MPPRGKKKSKASRKRRASGSRKSSAARKTRRSTARSRAGASRKTSARKTSARKTAVSRKRAAKPAAKRTARRSAKPGTGSRKSHTPARRRIPAQPAASNQPPTFGGGMAGDMGGERDEMIPLGTDELIDDEADVDLGGDEGGGDDDLEGM